MPPQTFAHTLTIHASPEKIYEYLIDPLRISKHIDRTQKCEIIAGPGKGKGTVSRWTWDDSTGKIVTWEEEIIEAIPNKKMQFQYRTFRNIIGTHELTPVANGTEIIFTETHDYEGIDPVISQRDVEYALISLKKTIESL